MTSLRRKQIRPLSGGSETDQTSSNADLSGCVAAFPVWKRVIWAIRQNRKTALTLLITLNTANNINTANNRIHQQKFPRFAVAILPAAELVFGSFSV